MPNTQFLAEFIGIYCFVMGVSMAARRDMMMRIFHEVSRNRALSYVMGVWMLIIALSLVLSHQSWHGSVAVIITLLGWGVFLESIVFLFASEKALEKYMGALNNPSAYYCIAAGYLILGLFLAYEGFFGTS